MRIHNTGFYGPTGRIHGSYVYMLLCRDGDGPIYAKVGFSRDPLDRLKQLRCGCPVTPRQFAYVGLRSPERARKIEADLHLALRQWHLTGEWFMVQLSEKATFNRAWKDIFTLNYENGWELKWTQINVIEFTRLLQRRLQWTRHLFKSRGRAYQDFVRSSHRG